MAFRHTRRLICHCTIALTGADLKANRHDNAQLGTAEAREVWPNEAARKPRGIRCGFSSYGSASGELSATGDAIGVNDPLSMNEKT